MEKILFVICGGNDPDIILQEVTKSVQPKVLSFFNICFS
jgi:hypothetical protein